MSKIRESMESIWSRAGERRPTLSERRWWIEVDGNPGSAFSNSHNHNKKLSQLNDFCSIRNNQFFSTEPRQTWINRKRINRDLDSLHFVLLKFSFRAAFGVFFYSRTKIYWFSLLIIVDFPYVCVEFNLLNKNNNFKIVLKFEWMVIEFGWAERWVNNEVLYEVEWNEKKKAFWWILMNIKGKQRLKHCFMNFWSEKKKFAHDIAKITREKATLDWISF